MVLGTWAGINIYFVHTVNEKADEITSCFVHPFYLFVFGSLAKLFAYIYFIYMCELDVDISELSKCMRSTLLGLSAMLIGLLFSYIMDLHSDQCVIEMKEVSSSNIVFLIWHIILSFALFVPFFVTAKEIFPFASNFLQIMAFIATHLPVPTSSLLNTQTTSGETPSPSQHSLIPETTSDLYSANSIFNSSLSGGPPAELPTPATELTNALSAEAEIPRRLDVVIQMYEEKKQLSDAQAEANVPQHIRHNPKPPPITDEIALCHKKIDELRLKYPNRIFGIITTSVGFGVGELQTKTTNRINSNVQSSDVQSSDVQSSDVQSSDIAQLKNNSEES